MWQYPSDDTISTSKLLMSTCTCIPRCLHKTKIATKYFDVQLKIPFPLVQVDNYHLKFHFFIFKIL